MLGDLETSMGLTPRPVADTVDELLAGVTRVGRHQPSETRSGAAFERVEVDGEPCLVKYVHPDDDFAMRAGGDIGCLPLRAWASGLMDSVPELIDHATLGAARWGRNGWGAALLMRDVSDHLIPPTGEPIAHEVHAACLDHLAGLAARHWAWRDPFGLQPAERRWQFFSPPVLAGERDLGYPEPVPRIALEGWERFEARAPGDVREVVAALRGDVCALVRAVRDTPWTFLHGDWKLSNLGHGADGRTILLDWTYVGEGPVCHELAWYLALNRACLPVGVTKEDTIEALRSALERYGVDTRSGWWERQLEVCLLGALVQFGWEKAYDEPEELGWWCDRAREGAAWL